MKELLWKRKGKFIQYLAATFLFIIEHFIQMIMFSLLLGAVQSGIMGNFKKVVLLSFIVALYSGISFAVSRMLRIGFMKDTILAVRIKAFDRIMGMSFGQFSKKSKETYISNLVNDINTFENNFFVNLLNFLINVGMFVISFVALLFLLPELAIGLLVGSSILYFITKACANKTTKLQQEVSDQNEAFTTEMGNTFHGLEILKLNRIEDKFLKKSLSATNRLEKKKMLFTIFGEAQGTVIQSLGYTISIMAMLYLSMLFAKGQIEITKATLCFQMTGMLFYLINAFPTLNLMRSSLSIYEKITNPVEAEIQKSEKTSELFLRKEIKAEDLSFSHGNSVIFTNANFTIQAGKKYLIKGVSGAGKSTLLNMLSMMNEEYEGKLLADGVDFKEIKQRSFHDKSAFIYQDVFLFEDTICNNISLFRDIPEERMNQIVKSCGLSDLIEEKQGGLDALLMENGKDLSGGQRQRISIARALARDAELLFVDEGTSSLNPELGKEIEALFLGLDKTVIAISHRYYEDVTNKYDYVLEIRNKAVVQQTAEEYFKEEIL